MDWQTFVVKLLYRNKLVWDKKIKVNNITGGSGYKNALEKTVKYGPYWPSERGFEIRIKRC